MSAENIHSGPSCPSGANACHWNHHFCGQDLWCGATAAAGSLFCDRHDPTREDADREPRGIPA